jgi:hypothetical protein
MTNDQIIAILYANTTCAEDINACTNLDWMCKFARALLATQAIPVPQNGDEIVALTNDELNALTKERFGNMHSQYAEGFRRLMRNAIEANDKKRCAAFESSNAAAGGETDINTALEQAAKALEKSGMRDDSRIVRGMKPGYPPTARGKLIAAHGASQDGDEPEKGILSEKELLVLWDQSTDEVEGPSRVDGSMTAWILAYGRAVREAVLASNKDGDERARFEAWFATNKEHAYGWSPRYAALEAWQAALASNKAAAEVVGELYVKLFRPSTGDVFKALRTDSAGIGDLLREGWEISATPPAPIASAEEWNSLTYLCSLLPADVHWGDDLTPDIARQIVQAAATHLAAAQPSRARVLEEAAKLCDLAFANVAPGHGGSYEEGCRDAFDLAGSQIRALKDKP